MWTRCAALILLAALAGCGATVRGVRVDRVYEAPRAASGPQVQLQYFGNGGWLITRGEDMVATAPFVSNPGFPGMYLPWSRSDTARIEAKIPSMPELEVMLIGHTHYDHAMDLPYILAEKAPRTKLYGSTTLKHLLGPTIGQDRVFDVTDSAATGLTPGKWVYPAGAPYVRFMPLSSTHAPHFAKSIKLVSSKKLTEDVRPGKLPKTPCGWPEGETLAYVIDFLSRKDRSVEFRVYYQDAAADPGKGILPTLDPPDDAPVDVGILCVAAFAEVWGNPEGILANVRPRHVVGGHWEDFFLCPSAGDERRTAFGTSLDDFIARARAVTAAPIYIPAPGQTVGIRVEPRATQGAPARRATRH